MDFLDLSNADCQPKHTTRINSHSFQQLAQDRQRSMLRHKAYGKRIRLLRDERCWTQHELAAAAGYSIKTIWKAEAGKALKRQTLADIAKALAVPIEEIARLPSIDQRPRSSTCISEHDGASRSFRKSSDSVPR